LLAEEEEKAKQGKSEIGKLRIEEGIKGLIKHKNFKEQLDTKKLGDLGESAEKLTPNEKIR